MARPRISKLHTWENHEKRVLEVLEEALAILQTRSNLIQSEVELNRQLYFCLLEANHKLWKMNRGLDHPPTSEAKNPPSPDDEFHTPREDKIPDFLWGFQDHLGIDDPRRQARYYTIECKRLGKPTRSDWVLNTNYIQKGIRRFITEEHGYALGEKSAAMVGYIESMDFDEILLEVNSACHDALLPAILLPASVWQNHGTTRLEQELERLFPGSPFRLWHYWVDLREKYISKKRHTKPIVVQQKLDLAEDTDVPE